MTLFKVYSDFVVIAQAGMYLIIIIHRIHTIWRAEIFLECVNREPLNESGRDYWRGNLGVSPVA
jgi:hypothetical protein